MGQRIFAPDLGTLSILPPELRDRIYKHLLDFTVQSLDDKPECQCGSGLPPLRTLAAMNILWVSKRIHQASKIVYFQTNEFEVTIERDYRNAAINRSITGRLGWNLLCADWNRAKAYWNKVPYEMIPYMRQIHFSVGPEEGCAELDIAPQKVRYISGPERPTYFLLQELVNDLCAIFATCHQIHMLRISIRSIEERPGSIENLLVPIRKLRGIKATRPVVWSMQEDMWVDWNMKASYGLYLDRLLALPKGAPHIKYVEDKKSSNRHDLGIFDIIGGYWNGGKGFVYPEDSDLTDDPEDMAFTDAYDDYMDSEEEFADWDEFINHPEGWNASHWGAVENQNTEDDAISLD